MRTVVDAIKEIKETTLTQDENGQFERGSAEHQDAARIVEMYLTNFYLVHGNEIEELTAGAVLHAMLDLQVRDYALGLVTEDNIDSMYNALVHLSQLAPEPIYKNAPETIAAMIAWELGKEATAVAHLNEAQTTYPLAQLLTRCFMAHYPYNAFKEMREELHGKVTTGIFGEDN